MTGGLSLCSAALIGASGARPPAKTLMEVRDEIISAPLRTLASIIGDTGADLAPPRLLVSSLRPRHPRTSESGPVRPISGWQPSRAESAAGARTRELFRLFNPPGWRSARARAPVTPYRLLAGLGRGVIGHERAQTEPIVCSAGQNNSHLSRASFSSCHRQILSARRRRPAPRPSVPAASKSAGEQPPAPEVERPPGEGRLSYCCRARRAPPSGRPVLARPYLAAAGATLSDSIGPQPRAIAT